MNAQRCPTCGFRLSRPRRASIYATPAAVRFEDVPGAEGEAWRAFLRTWLSRYGSALVSTAALVALPEAASVVGHRRANILARLLGRRLPMTFDGWQIRRFGVKSKTPAGHPFVAAMYALEEVSPLSGTPCSNTTHGDPAGHPGSLEPLNHQEGIRRSQHEDEA